MLEYQDKTVQEVAACTCDRCQRRMTRDDLDWHEKLSVAFRGGYGSIFGDGRMVSIDLCQQCIKEALGPWLRIESVDEGVFSVKGVDGLDYQERLRAEWDREDR